MKNKCLAILTGIVFTCTGNIFAGGGKNNELSKNAFAAADTLCTPNPSREAVALYRYLLDMKEQLTLTGQMWVPWGINEIDYIETNTGQKPAIAGFDFIDEAENDSEVQKAINYWKEGGIPTIMWHWGAPGVGEGYQASKVMIDISLCFIPGTDEYTDFWTELALKADHLQVLRDSGVPVIWRPFHELSGGWFWWSGDGPAAFKQLWITMYNYFVNDRGLNNLIWTLCYDSAPDTAWLPGHQYIDIVGGDSYSTGSRPIPIMYTRSEIVAGDHNYPICFHECGTPPRPNDALLSGVMYSWWMIWHTNYLQAVTMSYLVGVYNSDLTITHDELPDIMAVYNWNDSCTNSPVIPSMQVDTGAWVDTNIVIVRAGTEVKFRTTISADGTLVWNGCDVSGDAAEQTTTANRSCTARATFTNICGATSTQTFNIVLDTSTIISSNENPTYNAGFKVYPNPAREYLNITLKSQMKVVSGKITIYNLVGSEILKTEVLNEQITIDISSLADGFYIIGFENNGYKEIQSFLKIQ